MNCAASIYGTQDQLWPQQ